MHNKLLSEMQAKAYEREEGYMIELKSVGSVFSLATGNVWPAPAEGSLCKFTEDGIHVTNTCHEWQEELSGADKMIVYSFLAGLTELDLFNQMGFLPENVQTELDAWAETIATADQDTYELLRQMEEAMKKYNLTFEWGLDAEPFNLKLRKDA